MNALRRGVDWLLGGAICVLMGAMVINVLWQVFTRFVIRDPSSFTEEAARYMMIWVGLLGSAYAGVRLGQVRERCRWNFLGFWKLAVSH